MKIAKLPIIFFATFLLSSCGHEYVEESTQTEAKAKVQILCRTSADVSMRATLNANGKALTDLFIFDYDKATGKLLQVLHQTSDAVDFAEPSIMLDYGNHVLKVVATRSENPVIIDASGKTWGAASNVLTPIVNEIPNALTSDKTSDTFGACCDVSVNVGLSQSISLTLERLVAKLVIKSTDTFPDDCSTIEMSLNEYRNFYWDNFDVTRAETNKRVTDVSSLAGKTGTTVSSFVFTPKDGYTTDISFTTNRKEGLPYANITVPNVPFERNKVTTVTGSFYNHQMGFSFSLNDTWNEEINDIIF